MTLATAVDICVGLVCNRHAGMLTDPDLEYLRNRLLDTSLTDGRAAARSWVALRAGSSSALLVCAGRQFVIVQQWPPLVADVSRSGQMKGPCVD